jgi:hypothetical protein
MRVLFLLFPLVLLACPSPSAITIEIKNRGEEPLYLQTDWGGPRADVEFEVDGEWRRLVGDFDCVGRCGAVGGVIACADVAAAPVVWALLPEGFEQIQIDGRANVLDPARNCYQRRVLDGSLRVEVCHGLEAVDETGAPIEATEGGLVGADGFAEVVDPVCTSAEFDTAVDGRLLVVELP